MIIKSYELKNFLGKKNNIFLFYGPNAELIEEIISKDIKPAFLEKIYKYDELEVLSNRDSFETELLNQSFFENDKLIIISRATDKILQIIEDIIQIQNDDIKIIIKANSLEKKSKLRNFFEKSKSTICVAFYEDNIQTLCLIAQKFLRERKINISQQDLNILAERAKGDRKNLYNELEKIVNFSFRKKNIGINEILKLSNLSENYDLSELVDSCLSKNKKKLKIGRAHV